MAKPRFFTMRVKLDKAFTRGTQDVPNRVGSSFKAFAVIGTNNSAFKLNLVPDAVDGSVKGLPLYDGFFHNFATLPNDAIFENPVAQSDVWVDVLFSTEDELNLASIRSESKAIVMITGGSGYDHDAKIVTAAGSLFLAANDQRASADVYNQTGVEFYVGKEAKILAADFADTCVKIRPGDPFKWDLPDALWARKDGGTDIKPVVLEKNKVS